jgi:hypothetical protein
LPLEPLGYFHVGEVVETVPVPCGDGPAWEIARAPSGGGHMRGIVG